MSQTRRKEVSKAWTGKKNYYDTDKDTNPLPFIPYITNLGFVTLSGGEHHVECSAINRCHDISLSKESLNAAPISQIEK